ncbi:aminotransferase class I/II-fold pyridoxal phosphate-dependent enzyme, partial [Pseudomonas sp. Fl4BN1]|uniref:aminotransferase class I/II-fold pyridoxal phosphate-dependent enzyme n=1 Tax=Pseudomonas sp. Fl4BN1 TaxID=2697651 RepID=UPI002114F90A
MEGDLVNAEPTRPLYTTYAGYSLNKMNELEARLKDAREGGARHVLIATDGVFSMDGVIANLKGVGDLAD